MEDCKNNNLIKAQVKDAMLKRALGYDYEEKIVEANKDGRSSKVKVVKKHMPPDPKLLEEILYYIKNDEW